MKKINLYQAKKQFFLSEAKKHNSIVVYEIMNIDSKYLINKLIQNIKQYGFVLKTINIQKKRSNKKTFSAKNLINLQIGRGEKDVHTFNFSFSIDYSITNDNNKGTI